ncbi:MAG: response regulator transcription factor [Sphaerochaeta sp.]
MYRILILGTEVWLRKYLVKTITAMNLNFKIVDAVDNGQIALHEIKEGKIDIVISDIILSTIDGYELLKFSHDRKLKTKFIFISEYENFSLIKSAMKIDDIDYVLKPIKKEELISAVERVCIQIDFENGRDLLEIKICNDLHKIFRNYIIDRDESELVNAYRIFEDSSNKYTSMMFAVVQSSIRLQNEKDIEDFFYEVLKESFSEDSMFIVSSSSSKLFIFLLHKGDDTLLPFFYESLQNDIEGLDMKLQSIIELSPWFDDVHSFPLQLEEIEKKVEEKRYQVEKERKIEREKLGNMESKLIEFIEAYDSDSFSKYIENLKNEYEKSNFEISSCRVMLFFLTSDIIKLLEEETDEKKELYIEDGYEFCVKIYNYSDINYLLDWMVNYVNDVILFMQQNKVFGTNNVVKQVYKLIQVNYMDDIKLSSICDRYEITPSYFSYKFKETFGMNFVDYLKDIRINAAKKLLVDTALSVKEISGRVGFKDSKYFSKVFTSYVGKSPSKYRAKKRKPTFR